MLNKIILVCLLILGNAVLQAQTIGINPDNPGSYTVVKGDTLWDIAGRFLQEPWHWPEIWQVNPQIEDPHLIYPGDVVTLSFEGGTPVLTVARGLDMDEDTGSDFRSVEEDIGVVRQVATNRDVKLSPAIREYPRGEAIHSIPIEVIRHFLSRPLVVSNEEINDWPYVVSGLDGHLIAGENDRVFVRGLNREGNTNNYSIYRKGPAYESDGKTLGYEALHIADAVVLRAGDPATVLITQSNREVLAGDRLFAQSEKDINSDFIPHSPSSNITGSIISAIDGVSEIGRYQIVILDRGSLHGLEVGNVLGIYQRGEVVNDQIINQKVGGLNNTALMKYLGKFKSTKEEVNLPDEFTGVLMVFRIFDQVSYGLIMEAYGPVHMHDIVRNL